jgi:hypothetical protein
MPLEVATYIRDLINANPPGTDQVSQGDDHLRLIKSTLLNTFPTLCGPNLALLAGGTANALTLTYPTAPGSNLAGEMIAFGVSNVNTGPTTISVNGNAAIPLVYGGMALVGGELQVGTVYVAIVSPSGGQFHLVSSPSPIATSPVGFRNVLYNPNMYLAQRIGMTQGNSLLPAASTTLYQMDRWYFALGANQASNVSYQPASAPVGNIGTGAYQRTAGQTGTAQVWVGQPLDSDQIVPLQGKMVILTARIYMTATFTGTGSIAMDFNIGTGPPMKITGGFTGQTNVITKAIPATTGVWQTITATSATPVPANATQGEVRVYWTPVGTAPANEVLYIGNVQLEAGTQFSGFEYRPAAVELGICQRYYCKSFGLVTQPAQNAGQTNSSVFSQVLGAAGGQQSGSILFPVRMRIVPALTFFNPSALNAQIRNVTGGTDWTGTAGAIGGETMFSVQGATPAGSVVGSVAALHWTADAEI